MLPVLKTRLMLPPVKPFSIPRQGLNQLLDSAISYKLTLIHAPAGYGKTTAVVQWANDIEGLCWLTVEKSENELSNFIQYFIGSIQSLLPDFGQQILPILPDIKSEAEYIFSLLINEICEIEQQLILVLDGIHHLSYPPIFKGLTYFLRHLPSNFKLIILSRSEPTQLPLNQFRAYQELFEISVEHLRFSIEEVILCMQTMDVVLSEEQCLILTKKTEGWPFCLHLALVSIQHTSNQNHFFNLFSASNRFIADYLAEEVYQQLESGLQQRLLEWSVVERFNKDLCQSLSQTSSSIELDKLQTLVFPVDHERYWYRFHHLFAEWLGQKLSKDSPEKVVTLQSKAAQWFLENNDIEEAIEYFLKAKKYSQALKLLENRVPDLIATNQLMPVLNWLQQIPQQELMQHDSLAIEYGFTLIASQAYGKAHQWIELIADSWQEDKDSQDPVIQAKLINLTVILSQLKGHFEQAIEQARQAIELVKDTHPKVSYESHFYLASAYFRSECFEKSLEEYNLAAHQAKLAREVLPLLQIQMHQVRLLLYQGQLDLAEEILLAMLEMIHEQGLSIHGITALVYCRLGTIAYFNGELSKCMIMFEKSLAIPEDLKYTLHCRMYMLSTYIALQDKSQCESLLIDLRSRVLDSPFSTSNIKDTFGMLEASFELSQGNFEFLKVWLNEQGNLFLQEIPLSRYQVVLNHCYHMLHKKLFEETISLILQFCKRLSNAKMMTRLVRFLYLKAYILYKQSRQDEAYSCLKEAFSLTGKNYSQLYIDVLFEPLPLLKGFHSAFPQFETEYLAAIIQSLECEPRSYLFKSRDVSNPLFEALSEREQEIVLLIIAGETNQAISERSFISPNTLKTHIKNIYRKLGVKSRSEAIALLTQA